MWSAAALGCGNLSKIGLSAFRGKQPLVESFTIAAMRFQYEITLQEFLEMAWLRYRSSLRGIIGMCLAAIVFALGVFCYVFVAHDLGLYLVGLSIVFALILLAATSLSFRRVYRRNRRMFGMRTVSINDAGVISDHPLGHSETNWNMFDQFRETEHIFLLYQSADLISILPKRMFAAPAELEQFQALIMTKIRKA